MVTVFAGLIGCSSHVHVPQAGAEVKKADMKIVENGKYLDEVVGCDYEHYTTDWRRADKYWELQIMNARYEALRPRHSLRLRQICKVILALAAFRLDTQGSLVILFPKLKFCCQVNCRNINF